MRQIFTMKLITTLCILGLLSLVSACHQPQQSTSNDSKNISTSSVMGSATEPTNNNQILISHDNKITLNIADGHFTDIITQQSEHPEGIEANELTLLQYDKTRDITLYTTNLGNTKTDAKIYFDNLSTALKSEKNLKNVQIGIATDNRMNYRFSQNDAQGRLLNENCISIHESKLYNICASSHTASQETLSSVLQDFSISQ